MTVSQLSIINLVRVFACMCVRGGGLSHWHYWRFSNINGTNISLKNTVSLTFVELKKDLGSCFLPTEIVLCHLHPEVLHYWPLLHPCAGTTLKTHLLASSHMYTLYTIYTVNTTGPHRFSSHWSPMSTQCWGKWETTVRLWLKPQ